MSKLIPPINKNDHIKGHADATIALVEYGDYQCPHCGAAHPMIKQIQKTFGKKLLFVFRHFPLSNVHEYAIRAAISAEAAGKQNKFWQMHDYIFEHQDELSEYVFLEFAKSLKLNIPAFKVDVQDESLAEKVDADFESGVRSGVNGTPSFFINGYKYNGNYDYISLSTAIGQIESVV